MTTNTKKDSVPLDTELDGDDGSVSRRCTAENAEGADESSEDPKNYIPVKKDVPMAGEAPNTGAEDSLDPTGENGYPLITPDPSVYTSSDGEYGRHDVLLTLPDVRKKVTIDL